MYKIKQSKKMFALSAIAAGLVAWGSTNAIEFHNLTHIDATTGVLDHNTFNSTTINGAIFSTLPNTTIVGTGVLDPFIRIQATHNNALNINQGANCNNNTGEGCVEVGYNTNGATDGSNAVQFQEHDAQGHNWNHTIKLGDMQKDCDASGCYYTFVLDINERHNGAQGDSKLDQFLSLDQFRIFTDAGIVGGNENLENYLTNGSTLTSGPEGDSTTKPIYDPTLHTLGGQKSVFDMDVGGVCNNNGSPSDTNPYPSTDGKATICDRTVGLNYANNSGSGKGVDLVVKVPDFVFAGATNVYLFSSFGELGINKGTDDGKNKPAPTLPSGDFSQSAGFEEWSYKRGTAAPIVPTLALIALGFVAMGGMRKMRFTPRFA